MIALINVTLTKNELISLITTATPNVSFKRLDLGQWVDGKNKMWAWDINKLEKQSEKQLMRLYNSLRKSINEEILV